MIFLHTFIIVIVIYFLHLVYCVIPNKNALKKWLWLQLVEWFFFHYSFSKGMVCCKNCKHSVFCIDWWLVIMLHRMWHTKMTPLFFYQKKKSFYTHMYLVFYQSQCRGILDLRYLFLCIGRIFFYRDCFTRLRHTFLDRMHHSQYEHLFPELWELCHLQGLLFGPRAMFCTYGTTLNQFVAWTLYEEIDWLHDHKSGWNTYHSGIKYV